MKTELTYLTNGNVVRKAFYLTKFIFVTFILVYSNNIFGDNGEFVTCYNNKNLQKNRSDELRKLVINDQLDRKKITKILNKDFKKIRERDLVRRKRVGEIFGEGCLASAEDYLAAALIYQHGDTPDHYYQAYIWAKRAAELGSSLGKDLSALAIDRYLINTGRKQLFGTQFYIVEQKPKNPCFCIQEVELSFPDSLRKKYSGYFLKERLNIIIKFSGVKRCANPCIQKLKTVSKGSVHGIW